MAVDRRVESAVGRRRRRQVTPLPIPVTTSLRTLIGDPRQSVLICDYDGTLAPIVADPTQARAVPGAAEALSALATVLKRVAVVSGRPIEFLHDRLGAMPGVDRFGLYGTQSEIDGVITTDPLVASYRDSVMALVAMFERELPELRIEVKDDVMAVVHWRETPELAERARTFVVNAAAEAGVWAFDNRMAIEVRPPVAITKATTAAGIAGNADHAVMCGDDRADFEAVVALDALVERGALRSAGAVVVHSTEIPGEFSTRADLTVADPVEMVAALGALAIELGA